MDMYLEAIMYPKGSNFYNRFHWVLDILITIFFFVMVVFFYLALLNIGGTWLIPLIMGIFFFAIKWSNVKEANARVRRKLAIVGEKAYLTSSSFPFKRTQAYHISELKFKDAEFWNPLTGKTIKTKKDFVQIDIYGLHPLYFEKVKFNSLMKNHFPIK